MYYIQPVCVYNASYRPMSGPTAMIYTEFDSCNSGEFYLGIATGNAYTMRFESAF